MYKYTLIIVLTLSLVPQNSSAAPGLSDLILQLTDVIGILISVGLSVAVLVFVWGVTSMILAGGDDKALETGRKRMLWGVVGLFVIVTVWGIVSVFQEIVGVDPDKTNCDSPKVPTGGAMYVESC